jgi:hypothetical protein
MLSAVTTSLLVCIVKLFIWHVAVRCLCVCMPDVLVCGMSGCEPQTNIVTETCRVLIMCFTNLFNNLVF